MVRASTFGDFVDAAQSVRHLLPVVTRDIGDTWNYGPPSDPLKNQQFREMSRLRAQCVRDGRCDPGSLAMQRFDRLLTKIPEHTWGEDTTWYLHDYDNWTNAQLQAALGQENYRMTVDSWLDQRQYLPNAVAILDRASEHAYTQLAKDIRAALASLEPARPAPSRSTGWLRATSGQNGQNGQNGQRFVCHGASFAFAPDASLEWTPTPALGTHPGCAANHGSAMACCGQDGRVSLQHQCPAEAPTCVGYEAGKKLGKCTGSTPHVFGRYVYQTLDAQDFTDFDNDYGNRGCGPTTENPGCHNFNKPNMSSADPHHLEVSPALSQLWYKPSASPDTGDKTAIAACEFLVEGRVSGNVTTLYGAPTTVWTEVKVMGDGDGYSITFDVQWFNKTATRLAEVCAPGVDSCEVVSVLFVCLYRCV